MGFTSDTDFEKVCQTLLPYIKSETLSYPERHREDLYQEGMIAIEAALRSFDESKGVPFDAYAKICVKRRMITAYEAMRRSDDAITMGDDDSFADERDLENDIVERRYTEELFLGIRKELTELEKKVLSEYLQDKSYSEIADALKISEKTVDNSLSRIKSKIRKFFTEN